MLVQHSGSESVDCLVCSADPGINLFVEGTVTVDDTTEVFELLYSLQRCSLDGSGGATDSADSSLDWNRTSVLARLMERPKRWADQ